MRFSGRERFPYVVIFLGVGAVVWAVLHQSHPPADFTFINGTEIQSVDPAIVTGAPEGRIINALFEGLYRQTPTRDDPTKLRPQPAMAEDCSISEDGLTYTFSIRRNAHWSDGTSVTAHDFVWSWRRMLHPETASRYSYQLYYIKNAKKYNTAEVARGGRIEVELYDRPRANQDEQLFPRGTILSGVLREIIKPARPNPKAGASPEQVERQDAQWKATWTYVAEIKSEVDGHIDWDSQGTLRRFVKSPDEFPGESGERLQRCHHVLPHFDDTVGVKAADDRTLVVTLENPTPYFLDLVAFYPLYPVNRRCVEQFGYPDWTKPRNIVGNGPFKIQFRRIRDRIRLEKNDRYWNKDKVQLNVIDALAVTSYTTGLNMYENGQVDWAYEVPQSVIPELQRRSDFICEPMLTTYFYRVNVRRKPLDNPLVRRALNMAIDKQEICEAVTRAGQIPARSFVPPGLTGYESAEGGDFDVEAARRLLGEAGFPDGRGFRKIEILYNKSEAHEAIAEVIQRHWKEKLGIDVELKKLEWGVYLDTTRSGQYDVARAGWIGDYPDPNTFLDMFVAGGTNNETGWGNSRFDALIHDAAAESDPADRLKMLHDAEAILMDQAPILPIYFYVSKNMIRPYVKGFYPNIQDVHPLHLLRIDAEEKRRVLRGGGPR